MCCEFMLSLQPAEVQFLKAIYSIKIDRMEETTTILLKSRPLVSTESLQP